MNQELQLTQQSLGAQTLSASLGNGLDIFYLSPVTPPLNKQAPARGGVPVLFPQFAELGRLTKHGFARTAQWQKIEHMISTGHQSSCYALNIAPEQYADWPHAARLELSTEVSPNKFSARLQIVNTGSNFFQWTGGLHPYFAVDSLLNVTITGLQGLHVQDRYNSSATLESATTLSFNDTACEKLYDGCTALSLKSSERHIHLQASGFDQWMVWNPGRTGGDALSDLPGGDWQRFVCIEPACVSRPVLLLPDEAFVGTLDVRLLSDTQNLEKTHNTHSFQNNLTTTRLPVL